MKKEKILESKTKLEKIQKNLKSDLNNVKKSIEKIQSTQYDEESFLKDRVSLFKEFGINIDEESDKDLYDK